MKILLIDIETRPNLAHVWGIWDQNVGLNQLLESAEIMCWGAKWLGEPLLRFKSTYHDGRKRMVKGAWNLLDRADAVMHYNGRRFDVPHLNREFLRADLLPPSPFKQIDLLQVVRKRFQFPSYKLEYVAPELGIGEKVKHEGHELWLKCMEKDPAAWDRMQTYNIRDVQLLEDLYYKLLPWITNHPSHGALNGGERCCPNCGGSHLQARGFATTKTSRYQRYQCKDCGTWSRDTKRESGTSVTEVVA